MNKQRIENIATLAEAEGIAADLRRRGYRVGVSGQSDNGRHTGRYCVNATPKRTGAARRGRPFAATTKQQITLRLDRAAVAAFRAAYTQGWQTAINAAVVRAAKRIK